MNDHNTIIELRKIHADVMELADSSGNITVRHIPEDKLGRSDALDHAKVESVSADQVIKIRQNAYLQSLEQ